MSSRKAPIVVALLCSLPLLLPVLSLGLYLPEEKPHKTGTVIGIHFGTTHSSVGVYKDGRIHIIPNDQGNPITPSLVSFTNTERLVGEAAKNQTVLNPDGTIFNIKRLIGRKFDDPEVQRDLKFLPYKVVNHNGHPYVEVKSQGRVLKYSPEEISAMILNNLKESAEAYLGKKIEDAVITVPEYFSDVQRQAMKDAAKIAGLNSVRIIDELTAAVMAYELETKYGYSHTKVLLFDLGGRRFDVSLLANDGGSLTYLATKGDPHLGGDSFDQRVMDYFINSIKKKHDKDISNDSEALWKLRWECERAKRALSNKAEVQMEITSLIDGANFSESLSRDLFEELNMDLFKNTIRSVKKVLADANLDKSDIHDIVMVGGSTRIPKVQELMKDMFIGKEPCMGVNPDEAKAYGAAILGSMFSGEDIDEIKGSQSGFHIFEVPAKGPPLTQEELDRLVKKAEEYAEEARIIKEKNDARNRLKTYIYNIKNQINDEDEMTYKNERVDMDRIYRRLKEALEWLEDNHNAEKHKYEEKLEEMEALCGPFNKGAQEKGGANIIELKGIKKIEKMRMSGRTRPLRMKGLPLRIHLVRYFV